MFPSRYLIPALLALTVATGSYTADLPSIGDTSSAIVSRRKEQELGEKFLVQLNSQARREVDPELVHYTETLVARLVEASQLPQVDLSVVLLDNPGLNAFAVPGNVVGINTGLFNYARTEAEFAAVIAHELAHLRLRHYARGVESQQQQQLPTLAAILGSILLAASGAPSAGAAALSSTVAGSLDARITFTRTHEQEADRVGVQIMADAGMDPRGMASLFERMGKLEGTGPRYEFLQTHPLSRSRLADTRARAERYAPVSGKKDNDAYALMQKRALLLASRSPAKERALFAGEVATGRTRSLDASRYALALAEQRLKKPEAAQQALSLLSKAGSRSLAVQILQQQVQFALGHHKDALQALEQLLMRNPGNYPISMALADLLEKDAQYKEAQALVSRTSKSRPQDTEVWYRLAEVAGLAGDRLQVHRARAEYFFLTGALSHATEQLKRALALPDIPFSSKEAMRHRLQEMQTSRQYRS